MLPVAILAGGLATRLRPLTESTPKSLLPVHGRPFVWHQLRLLQSKGVRKVVLCLGFLGQKIEEAIGDGSQLGLSVDYSYDGPRLLGTAGAVRAALSLLGESFFVMYGDSYLDCDYAAVQQAFLHSQKLALMTIFHNAGLWDTSNVEFEAGIIRAYSKKNRTVRMRYIDYGLGVFSAKAFERSAAGDLAELYAELLGAGELAALEVHERFYEIGSLEGLSEMARVLSPEGAS